MPTELVLMALEQALTIRQPALELLVHAELRQPVLPDRPVGIAEAGALASYV